MDITSLSNVQLGRNDKSQQVVCRLRFQNTLMGVIMSTGINKLDCLNKLWGNRDRFDVADMCEVLDGFDGTEMLSEPYGVLDKLQDFIWVRDKLQSKGIEIDDTALAYLMFK